MAEETEELEVPEVAELKAGTEVGGYVIEGKIGQGGMGVVYGAKQPRIGKRVAIKVLSPQYSSNPSTVRRFELEAQVVNEIKHPNIVDVFQFGELPDGRSYFVMEWLDGEPLSARIGRGAIPAREAMALLDLICDALEAAHEKGVIHRDLKSDNVFIVRGRNSRNVKLLDFGLAKLQGKNDGTAVDRTRSGMVVGTPAYMAPEQARGKAVDARTDIYALGVLAFKMLTATLPFKAENAMDLIVMHLNAPPPAPNKLAKEMPPELSKLVQRMMAKEPAQRPSLADVRKLFNELRGGSKTDVPAAAAPPRRMAKGVLLVLALILGAGITIGAIWLSQRNKGDDTQTVAAATGSETPGSTSATPTPGSASATPTPGSAASVTVPTPPTPPTAGSAEAGSAAVGSVGAGSAAVEPTSGVVPGSAVAVEPKPLEPIEFEPDNVGRGSGAGSGSATKRKKPTTAAEPADEEVDMTPPPNRPGSLILVLETASAIEIDGNAVAPSSKGGRFDVAPGHHRIRVKAPGRQPVDREFDVEAGGTAVLRVADDSGDAP